MPPKKDWFRPKSGIGPDILLQQAGTLTPERIASLDFLSKAAVDLADQIRARVVGRQEDAFGAGGFGPFNNSGGMWSSLQVRVTNKERVKIAFYDSSAKSTSWYRNAQTEENRKRRAQKQALIREKVVKVYESVKVSNQLKAAASIGIISPDGEGARPEFRRELLQPSVEELSQLVNAIVDKVDAASMQDALEYEAPTAMGRTKSLQVAKGTLKTFTKRITAKTP